MSVLGRLILALLATAMATGCATYRGTVVRPGTATIPLKVWVVLEDGDSGPGDESNIGCRLSLERINEVIQKLQNSSAVFGAGTRFEFDITSDLYVLEWDTGATTANRIFGDAPMILLMDDNGTPRYWDTGRINIYFTGNYNPFGIGSALYGATVGPNNTGTIGFTLPNIIINDGGSSFASGFGIEPWPRLLDTNTLPHEMAHYIGRFANRTFTLPNGSLSRQYNSSEHALLTVGDGPNSLLREGSRYPPPNGVYTPYKLYLHGDSTTVGTETYEIWGRVFSGTWNQP